MDHARESRLLEPTLSPPGADAQLQFLIKLQRLFNEGDFVATYKYALLMALAELAVEHGCDDGEAVTLTHTQIAQKFIELYWQQVAPYSSGRPGTVTDVLIQNSGVQAAVVTELARFRHEHPGVTLLTASQLPGYTAVRNAVATTVSAQPLKYLQNMGGQTDAFIYERQRGAIRLLPGVAYCLRRFQPLVNQLARTKWVAHIKSNKRNQQLLGESDDLESFLFETSRQTLATVAHGLRKLVSGRCFYCLEKVHDADVDHFVPFSLYPRDLMHNFVLAHPSCNRSKSNMLAAKVHLNHWLDYVDRYSNDLADIGNDAGVAVDSSASQAVVRWSYGSAAQQGARAWCRPGIYEVVTEDFMAAMLN